MAISPEQLNTMFQQVDIPLGPLPPCIIYIGGQPLEYIPGKSLTMRFPVLPQYLNPAGSMQGGFITAAFDNVFGPLCRLVTQTENTAVNINTSYHKPIYAGDFLTITASVKTRGRTMVHMTAEGFNQKGRLIASADTNYLILDSLRKKEEKA